MNIAIDDKVKGLCAETRMGVISYVANVDDKCDELWAYMQQTTLPRVRAILRDTPLAEFRNLGEVRAAYQAFGNDPKKHPVSSELLLCRIHQNDALNQINTVMDINNLISIESGFPVGSYDRDKLSSASVLRLGRSNEVYTIPNNKSIDIERLPVLADKIAPFGSTTVDSVRAMITPSSKNISTVIYSFSANNDLETYLLKALFWLEKYTKAQDIKSSIVE